MTFPRYLAFCKYWKRSPPLHKMVAAYLGTGGADNKPQGEDHRNLAGIFGGGQGKINVS